MPEWKFPVDLPRFTNDEYEAKKAAYVSEHGYTISPPKISDIIHIGLNREPDDEEFSRYDKSRRLDYLITKYPTSKSVPKWEDQREGLIDPGRYDNINNLMQRKRDKYNAMLASPAPTWLTNAGSVMTFFDDINDMAGTAAVLCRIAARFAPRILARFFLGPAGWLLLIAELFGLMMTLTRLPISCIVSKRHFHSVSEMNPFSKNARAVRARKLRRVLPGKGELIEMAQASDQLFGIGLCLGPIVGFAQDIVAGTVRAIRGEKVSWHGVPPKPSTPETHALRTLRFAQMVGLAKDIMTEDEHWLYMVALNGATQILKPYFDEWDPFDQVEGMEHALLEPPKPRYATTKSILEEFGVPPGEKIGWPGLDKKEATADELWNFYQDPCAESYTAFAMRNRRNQLGMTGAQNGYDFSKNMLLFASGYETVEENFAPGWDGWNKYYNDGCRLPDCFSFWGGEYTRRQATSRRMGDQVVTVICLDNYRRPTCLYIHDKGVMVPCGPCHIYFGPDLCGGTMKNHLAGVLFDSPYFPLEDGEDYKVWPITAL